MNFKTQIMLKNISNLGKSLKKSEQQSINGGAPRYCDAQTPCPPGYYCGPCHCVRIMIEI